MVMGAVKHHLSGLSGKRLVESDLSKDVKSKWRVCSK